MKTFKTFLLVLAFIGLSVSQLRATGVVTNSWIENGLQDKWIADHDRLSALSVPVKKSSVGNPLPNSLPIGSNEKLMEFMITNNSPALYPQVKLYVVGSNTNLPTVYRAAPDRGQHYASLQEWKNNMLTNAWKLYTAYIVPRKDVTTISMWYDVEYMDDAFQYAWIHADSTPVGNRGQITLDDLSTVGPTTVVCPVPLDEVTDVKIHEETDVPYDYHWSAAGVETSNDMIWQRIIDGFIYLSNDQFGINSVRTRVTLTAGPYQTTFTQDGDALRCPNQSISTSYLTLSVPAGSDVTVEYKINVTDPWQFAKKFDWRCHTNTFSQALYEYGPSAFYRTNVR